MIYTTNARLVPLMERREALVNVAMVVMSVLLVFAALEVGLQANIIQDNSREARLEGYPELRACSGFGIEEGARLSPEEPMRSHSTYGWVHRSDIQYLRKETPAEDWDQFTINDAGFRDTYDKGEQNVIVVGDSFTEGYLAGDEENYPYLLDRWATNTTFHNFGIAGYATDQELLLYRNVADRIDHDLVIVGYYLVNDAEDNTESGSVLDHSNRIRPRAVVEGGRVRIVPARNATTDQTDVDEANEESDQKGLVPTILSHPAVNAVQEFLEMHTETYPYLAPKIGGLIGNPPQPASGEELREQLTVTRALLKEFGREASSHDARVLVVVFPARGEINRDNPAYYRPEDGDPYWAAQRTMLEDVARNNSNVGVLNLKSHLREQVADGTRVYGEIDAHLNERGYLVTARAITERLGERYDITPTNSSVTATERCVT
jgi:hypothetical protein